MINSFKSVNTILLFAISILLIFFISELSILSIKVLGIMILYNAFRSINPDKMEAWMVRVRKRLEKATEAIKESSGK